MGFVGVFRALYDYAAQGDQELTLHEGDLLLVLDKSTEDEWWKAKRKTPGADGEEPVGLIPSNYIEEAEPTHRAKALYDYTRQTDEELSLVEDAAIMIYDTSDPDWTLVGLDGEYGFAPANYIELLEPLTPASPDPPSPPPKPEPKATPTAGSALATRADPGHGPAAALAGILQGKPPTSAPPLSPASPPADSSSRRAMYTPEASDDEPPTPPPPSLPARPPSQHIPSPPPVISPRSPESLRPPFSPTEFRPMQRTDTDPIPRSPGGFHLYNISEMVSVMGKRKKMPTTLGINIKTGTIMIAPEKSRDGPQQEWTGDKLTHYSIEGKHIFMELVRPSKSVDFHAGAKDTAEEIVSALGEIAGAVRAEGLKEVLAAGSGVDPNQKTGHVLYNFLAQGDDEVSVDVGDLVVILDDTKSAEWWMVRRVKNGQEGVMPSSYVEVTHSPSPPPRSTSGAEVNRARVEKNRLEEERLAKEAVKAKQNLNGDGSQLQPAELGLGVKLPKRGSSLMSKDGGSAHASQPRRRESKSDGKPPSTSKPKPDPSKTRTWTDRSGSFKVEAQFIGCTEGKIHLHKLNGVKIAVPVVKMSLEDLEYVEKITGMSLDEDKPLSEIKRRSQTIPNDQALSKVASPTTSAPASASASAPALGIEVQDNSKEENEWFNFFLKCGVAAHLCARYASSFSKDSMDESILPDVGPDVLRTLGLKEGDILKVMRYLDNLYGRAGPSKAKRNVSFGGAEVMGNEASSGERKAGSTSENAGGLFAGPGGTLRNNTRKGRPAPAVQTKDVVDPKVFESGANAAPKTTTKPSERTVSPTTNAPPPVEKDVGGFDDDAWSVKPAREQRSASQATSLPPATAAPSQPSQPVLTESMKELSLLSAPLEPTIVHSSSSQNSTQPPLPGPASAPAPTSSGPATGEQYNIAQPGQGQSVQQSPQRDGFQSVPPHGFQPQPPSVGLGSLQANVGARPRPQAPSQGIPNPAQFLIFPPPRPLSAPQNNSQQSVFAPPPLQQQLTGFQNPSGLQPRFGPSGQGLGPPQPTGFQPIPPPAPPSQSNAFVPSSQMSALPMTSSMPMTTGLMPQATGYGPPQLPQPGFPGPPPFMNGQVPGYTMANAQPASAFPPLTSQLTGAPPPFLSAVPQQPLRTGSINSFLPPALQPQPTGPSPLGPMFNAPPPSLPSIPPHFPVAAPLQPQKTGPAPPVRFGLAPEAKKLMPQATGRRANLAQATPENPFGF